MRRRRRGLDAFTRGYIEAALWSSTDDNDRQLDKNYGREDIAFGTLKRMVKDAREFQKDNAKALDKSGLSDSKAGYDFWLTRNHHGAGFWDEGTSMDRELTDAAHAYGSFDLYVGDDGKVHGS